MRYTTLILLQQLLETWQHVATALRRTCTESDHTHSVHTTVNTNGAVNTTNTVNTTVNTTSMHSHMHSHMQSAARTEGLCVSVGMMLRRRLPEVQTIAAAHALTVSGGGGGGVVRDGGGATGDAMVRVCWC